MELTILKNLNLSLTGRRKLEPFPLEVKMSFKEELPSVQTTDIADMVEFSSVAEFSYRKFDYMKNKEKVMADAEEAVKHALYGEVVHNLRMLKNFMWTEGVSPEGQSIELLEELIDELGLDKPKKPKKVHR